MQLRIYILRQRLPSLLWILLLLQRSPVVQTFSKVPALVSRAPFLSSAFLKKALPVLSGAVSFHALSGATTFVTSDDNNPVTGAPGDDFEFGFSTNEGGHFAFSYRVENLPDTLSYNNNAFGPLITGTLPEAGTRTINITGFRFAGLAGDSTPVYTLTLDVVAPDTTGPVISLSGDSTVTLTLGENYSEPGATATDETDGDVTADIVIGGDSVDTSTIGTYTITYNVSDTSGNAATEVTRTVVVQASTDTTGPFISLFGNSTIFLTQGNSYIELGATATDETDGDVNDKIVVAGDKVDESTAGTYIVTYNVSDAAGNAAEEVTRTVLVLTHEDFGDADNVTGSWWFLDWFGYLGIDPSNNGWSYHRELGWISIGSNSTRDNAWIYLGGSSIRGWFWASDDYLSRMGGLLEGYLYLVPDDGSAAAWHYVMVDSSAGSSTYGRAYLYDFVSGSWNLP